ncbi:NAD(P)/FAD-dependent oxidoreductase [Nocardia rhizosphaerae]|uniref:NAD(P)/FAD-dependent oxidoreductase n=1 Tax=Nocardia rhizosphaerae TaxID=1691571 RepID=A0ABV8LE09_9NOCA
MAITTGNRSGTPHRIVVLGAGYAGVLAANRTLSTLAKAGPHAPACTITVVNPRPDFVERIRLHEVAAGTRATAATPLTRVLHPDVRLLVGSAALIDPAAKLVDVAVGGDTTPVPYDTLVYAVGSGADRGVAGIAEHTFRIPTPESAARMSPSLRNLPEGARVVIVGGGPTGVETAAEIAAAHPRLRTELVSAGAVLDFMRPAARRKVTAQLERQGVTLRPDTSIDQVVDGALITTTGARIGFDACAWAAAFGVPDLAVRSGLTTDPAGRLRVDETLTSIDHPDIIGAGDAVTAPPSVADHLRMGCATALPLGGHAAAVVLARLHGDSPQPLSIGFVAQCLSLGRKSGYIQFVRADDSPRALSLGGRSAAKFKEWICAMTLDSLIEERRKPGAYKAPKGPSPTAARPAGVGS